MSIQLIPGRGLQRLAIATLSKTDIEFLPLAPIILAPKEVDHVYLPDIFGVTIQRILATDYTNVNASALFVIGSGVYVDVSDVQGFASMINGAGGFFTWGDDTVWHPSAENVFGSFPSSDDLEDAVGDLWFGMNNQEDGPLVGGTDGDVVRICVPFYTYDLKLGYYV